MDSRRDGDLKEIESDMKCTLFELYSGDEQREKEVDE